MDERLLATTLFTLESAARALFASADVARLAGCNDLAATIEQRAAEVLQTSERIARLSRRMGCGYSAVKAQDRSVKLRPEKPRDSMRRNG